MVLAVIPSRIGSTRLPGKALAPIGGVPMVVRVWERVRAAGAVDHVVVATEDEEIRHAVARAGGEVVMTGPCATGTDRVAQAARHFQADVVVNVQGDEPFVEPEVVDAVATAVDGIQTVCVSLDGDPEDPARVKVVTDVTGRALYFSRLPVPRGGPWQLHLGLYAFPADLLDTISRLAPSPLERAEGLEQLRWLEAGLPIRVVPVVSRSLSVDTPADLERARARWAAEHPEVQP